MLTAMTVMKNTLSRREFINASGAALTAVGWAASSYARILGANDRIGVAFIGAGGMGTNHLHAIRDLRAKNNLAPVAVADCWKRRANAGAAVVGAPQAFDDYRKVLDLPEVDYVTIATPEHWHAQMTMDAMDAGKAVYCEKPMTHTIPKPKR